VLDNVQAEQPRGWNSYVTVGEDNCIYHWDMANKKMVKRGILDDKKGKALKVRRAATDSLCPPNQCARAVSISPDGNDVAVGTNEGVVAIYNFSDFSLITRIDLNKHGKRNVTNQTENWIQELKYSPSGKTLAVGTHGSVICLLSTAGRQYAVKHVLGGHNSFITHLDWSADGKNMQSNDGAYELLFWDISEDALQNSKQNTYAAKLRDVQWASQTCILGYPVQGVFDPQQDGSDINGVDASKNRKLLVTADDYGAVNLFRYPCAAEGNKSRSFEGHASHCVSARFTQDDSHVITTGGGDRAVLVWRVADAPAGQ